jgi:hypothetical protein
VRRVDNGKPFETWSVGEIISYVKAGPMQATTVFTGTLGTAMATAIASGGFPIVTSVATTAWVRPAVQYGDGELRGEEG